MPVMTLGPRLPHMTDNQWRVYRLLFYRISHVYDVVPEPYHHSTKITVQSALKRVMAEGQFLDQDSVSIAEAFRWDRTAQGEGFWASVDDVFRRSGFPPYRLSPNEAADREMDARDQREVDLRTRGRPIGRNTTATAIGMGQGTGRSRLHRLRANKYEEEAEDPKARPIV